MITAEQKKQVLETIKISPTIRMAATLCGLRVGSVYSEIDRNPEFSNAVSEAIKEFQITTIAEINTAIANGKTKAIAVIESPISLPTYELWKKQHGL